MEKVMSKNRLIDSHDFDLVEKLLIEKYDYTDEDVVIKGI